MPTGYPSKGAWEFYNESRASAFWMVLDSISITQSNPDDVAVLSGDVVDTGTSMVFEVEDEIWAKFGGTRTFAGHVKVRGRTQVSEAGDRRFQLEAQDYTAKLDDTVVRRRSPRKREKARRRARWLLRDVLRFDMQRDLDAMPDEFVEKQDLFGMTVREALDNLADEKRLHYEVDFDDDEDGRPTLRMFRNEGTTAAFNLDDIAPDYITTFPYTEFQDSEDSSSLTNAVLVEPEKRNKMVWVRDSASIAEFGRQESYISDSEITKRKKAENIGLRALAENDQPLVEGTLVCHEPGLKSGTQVNIENDEWGIDYLRVITSVDIRAVDPHDSDGTAYLFSTISFSDRRRPGKRGGGGSSGDKANRRRRGRTGDATPHELDGFGRIVASPTITDGASAGVFANPYGARRSAAHTPLPAGPDSFAILSGTFLYSSSYLGSWYVGWTGTGSFCGSLDNAFSGWIEQEAWWKITVGAHPADAAGIKVQLKIGSGTGYGTSPEAIWEGVALSEQPTDTRQGTVIGECLADNTFVTMTVPQNNIPAEGGELHVGIRTKWQATYGDWTCGWTWPFSTWSSIYSKNSGDPWSGFSGRGIGPAISATSTWQINTSVESIGTTTVYDNEEKDAASWNGGNTWIDLGSEGAPDYSLDGDCIVLDAVGHAGKGFALAGDREDDDEEVGAWSEGSWMVEVEFEINRAGSLVDAGRRGLELTTVGEDTRNVGEVHIGDATNAQGISVSGPSSPVFKAKAIGNNEKWRARFDSRDDSIRGKMWRASDGQPAEWDVETVVIETEDAGDRFEMWMRAGDTGSNHILKVCRLRAGTRVASGDRIVKEYLGKAGGLTAHFQTSHAFERGSLRVWVNGAGVKPSFRDGELAEFSLDFKPTAGSFMRATYVVAD